MAILTTEVKTKLTNYKDEFLAVHPNNETIDDPKFVGEGKPNNISTFQIPKYTDAEWIDEYVKRHLIIQLKRGKKILLAQNDVIPEYDDL